MNPEETRLVFERNWGDCCVATGATMHDIQGAKAYVNTLARRAGGHSNSVLKTEASLENYPKIIAKANLLYSNNKLSYAFYESPIPKNKEVEGLFLSQGLGKAGDQTYMVFEGNSDHEGRRKLKAKLVTVAEIGVYADVIYTAFGWPTDSKDGWAESLRKAVKDERVVLLTAYVEDKPAGGLLLFSDHKVGSIYQVGTHPDFRGRGVAASLVLSAAEESEKRGDKLLWLRTTRGYAEQMYKKLGFTVAYRGVSYRFKPS